MPLLCALRVTAAWAQDSTPTPGVPTIPVQSQAAAEPEPAEAGPRAAQLDEVVVTATKREANPRDLPASVSAVRGEDLEKHGYQGQEDFLKLIPGVTFANDTVTANRITIRGIGADLNTSNTTGVFIGDVPFEDPTLPRVTLDPNPFDLARVEVLKGPQGTLFGGSALNGAVRYVPQDPELGSWEARTFAQYEVVNQGGMAPVAGAAVNVPAGDTLAFRLVGFHRNAAGWVDDLQRHLQDVNTLVQDGGRLMALWQPDGRWKVSAMGVVQDTRVADSSITDNRDGRLSRSDTPQASPINTRYDLETLGVQYSFPAFDILSQTSRTSKHFGGIEDASRIGNLTDNPPPS
ncbi:MAG TPA: TonB-dependent receptor, partial [Nevskiaceae bacterium]|nr:TonB-dependent receptor [Nevskiaceae bacterium]